MPGHDRHAAAARRDEGLRRVRRITWRAGAAGVICSAVIAIAFGHHAEAGTARPAVTPGRTAAPGQAPAAPGSIAVPSQPPAAVPGAGQVTSGGS
jgi:hypothetical protein